MESKDQEKDSLYLKLIPYFEKYGILLLLVLICIHIIFYLSLRNYNNWQTEYNLLIIICVDLFLAGFSLKLGGKLAKGPYLPQTLEGLGKTTKAVLGKK